MAGCTPGRFSTSANDGFSSLSSAAPKAVPKIVTGPIVACNARCGRGCCQDAATAYTWAHGRGVGVLLQPAQHRTRSTAGVSAVGRGGQALRGAGCSSAPPRAGRVLGSGGERGVSGDERRAVHCPPG